MRHIHFLFIIFLSIFFQSSLLKASEILEFYNGARGLAMGGASVAAVNDETALLINPAGLGKLRDKYGTILDPEFEASLNISRFYRNKAFTEFTTPEKIVSTLSKTTNTYYYAKNQFFPSFVVRNFGIGVFYKTELAALMNSAGTSMNTRYHKDAGLLLGYNFRFFDGRIKLGFTARMIARVEIDKDLDPTGSMSLASNASEGAGVATDTGLLLTLPWALLPTLGVTVHDMGGTKFTAASGVLMKSATQPNEVKQKVDAAIAFFPIHSNGVRSTFTLEYRDVLKADTTETNQTRKTHIGYELNLGDLAFLRLGMGQNFYSGGIEFSSERTQFQFTSYAEDIGTVTTPKKDNRYITKFVFRY
jgi:hypothetical protein